MKVRLKDITKRYGKLEAVKEISLTVNDGEFVTIVGPSGCGKTTTLRMVAGLESPTSGRIMFDGEDVTDATPPEREVALVFQDYALYPHMTARRNMSFALEETAQLSDEEIDAKVVETAEMLGIVDHLDKKPGELSGGQQQRVALGRSIVRDPRLFLLDEPLSNLDAKLRTQMRAELQKLHEDLEMTTLYVTHDQEEAMTMSDRIAVLDGGRLQQYDHPSAVYGVPKNRFVADFVGNPSMNFFDCREEGGTLRAGPFELDGRSRVEGRARQLGIRPEDLHITPAADEPMGRVRVFEHLGSENIVYIDVPEVEDDIVVQIPSGSDYSVNDPVALEFDLDDVHWFDASGNRIETATPAAEETLSTNGNK